MEQSINPYIAGAPLRHTRGFFGRQEILSWVKQQLYDPTINALVLFGQRRIGKTSFLFQLQRALPADSFLPVYFNLQYQATRSLGQILAHLAYKITEAADLEPISPAVFDNQGRFFQQTFLPRLEKVLGTKRRLVFLLDEFDMLDQQLPPTTAGKAFLRFLRGLMTDNLWPAFVFIMGKGAETHSKEFTAIFKGTQVGQLWVLDRKSAKQLIHQATADGSLQFTEQAVERILTLTNCHPYLTQLLCWHIWNRYATAPTTPALIDLAHVEATITVALLGGQEALTWWWEGLRPAEKIYAAAASSATEKGTIPEVLVIEQLATYAYALHTRPMKLAPRDLVKRRVFSVASEQEYRFSIELFRRWVQENKSLKYLKYEVYQNGPSADDIFKTGMSFFLGRQFKKAIRYFQEVLGIDPLHSKAQLYMGQAHLLKGQIDEAVIELEQAYQLDQKEATPALIRGLLSQARANAQAGDEEGALSACERMLSISPRQRSALALRAAIWARRGDAALAKGEPTVALRAYQEAGDAKKVKQVQVKQLRVPSIRTYRNFDLRLAEADNNLMLVEVLDAPAGEAMASTPIPRVTGLPKDSLASLAIELGQALMPADVRLCFEASRGMQTQRQEGLRIRLRIHGQTLSQIPWEAARIGQQYLSLQPHTPLVRYVSAPQPPTPLAVDGPISILGIISHPINLPPLDVTSEQTRLQQALKTLIELGEVELKWLSRADAQLLQEALRHDPHVIHYIGHASYDNKPKEGILWFTDHKKRRQALSADWLATLLRDSTVRFVFLNACASSAAGSLAEVLVRCGVPAVLGWQTALLDDVAIAFAAGFYRALRDGWPVDAAVVEARKAIVNAQPNHAHQPEWAQPVLYMRAPDGQLFEPR